MKKIIADNYLISLLLGVLGIKIMLLIIFKPTLWFDEAAISLISRHDIGKLLDTVLSERFHPPGFYFFVKLLPQQFPVFSKAILTIISHLIILGGIIFAKREGLLLRHRLETGIAIFFGSFLFQIITSDIKQDALSFPLVFVILIFLLKVFDTSKLSKKECIILGILLTLLFLTAYINYLLIFVGVLLVYYQRRKIRNLLYIIYSQIALAFIYLPYGILQYITSHERSVWTNSNLNSLVSSLGRSLVGISTSTVIDDAIIIVFLFAVFKAIKFEKTRSLSFIKQYMLFLSLTLPLVYFQKFFVAPRYTSFYFFLLCIVAGWGVDRLAKEFKFIHLKRGVFIFLFSASAMFYVMQIRQYNHFNESVVSFLNKTSASGRVGFVADSQNLTFVYKLWYLSDNPSVVAVNAFNPSVFVNKKHTGKAGPNSGKKW